MAESFKAQLSAHRMTIGLIVTVLCGLLLFHYTPSIKTLEWQLQDQFIQQRAGTREPANNILVIDIDDASLIGLSKALGKWPWPRSVHAELLEYLNTHQPKAIIFDILFSEPDFHRPDADAYFLETIQQSSNVYLAAATQKTLSHKHVPLLMSYEDSVGLVRTPSAKEDARALLLLPNIGKDHEFNVGSINLVPDADGVTRRYQIMQNLNGWGFPSLPARVAEDAGVALPNQETLMIDWLTNSTTPHQRISYAELLSQVRGEQQLFPSSFFNDKFIVIGTSALGLHDLRTTPINDFYPGVFILSTALDNLLNNGGLRLVSNTLTLAFIVSIIIGSAILFIANLTAISVAITGIGLLSLVVVSWLNALNGKLVLIMPGLIALSILLIGYLSIIYGKRKSELQKTIQIFSRFMDPAIVKKLLEKNQPEALLSTKNVEVTMLFSDIRNFTSISEQRTPGEMVSLLNHYFDRQVQTLFKHKATLDKFIGDAVMAFWGAPLEHEEHPVYAINAALDMIDNLDEFVKEYGYRDFDIGIGIHTGNAVVGLIGAHDRYDYTAIGDTVNLASRIEGLTKGRARILVSEFTKEIAEDHFTFIPQGEFQVKGRNQAVKVYEPKRLVTPPNRQE